MIDSNDRRSLVAADYADGRCAAILVKLKTLDSAFHLYPSVSLVFRYLNSEWHLICGRRS